MEDPLEKPTRDQEISFLSLYFRCGASFVQTNIQKEAQTDSMVDKYVIQTSQEHNGLGHRVP